MNLRSLSLVDITTEYWLSDYKKTVIHSVLH